MIALLRVDQDCVVTVLTTSNLQSESGPQVNQTEQDRKPKSDQDGIQGNHESWVYRTDPLVARETLVPSESKGLTTGRSEERGGALRSHQQHGWMSALD